MKKGLNLRVYRRTLDYIALLWNKSALTDEQLKNIAIYYIDRGNRKSLKFYTNDQMEGIVEEGIIAPDDTTLVMIQHEQNGLDPNSDYSLELIFNKTYKVRINVYAFGVLPPTERDDKKLNTHVYGYVEDEKRWAKIPLVRCKDGSLAIPIKLIRENG